MSCRSPTTSRTLLEALKQGSASSRWIEFDKKYRPWLASQLRANYPKITSRHEDIIQSVFVRVFKALPSYKFIDGEVGHFRSYLKCITRNVVCDLISKESRYEAFEDDDQAERLRFKHEQEFCETETEKERKKWMSHVLYIAFNQVLGDEGLDARTREVAYRLVIKHQKPDAILSALGGSLTANAIYQMKSRVMTKVAKNTRSLWAVLVTGKPVEVDYELRQLWASLARQKGNARITRELRSIAIDLSGELQ